jgi:hypothetical protein
MASVSAEPTPAAGGTGHEGFGATSRTDAWWAPSAAVLAGLGIFIIYSTWAGMQGRYFEIRPDIARFTGNPVAPYLSPFYSPLLYDEVSPHAWSHRPHPSWWPEWFPFSAAILILAGPGLFRFTCYYYRKAYYRAFWFDPFACAVGEPRKSYWGENHWPLLLQNIHRYTLYVALLFLLFLWWDVIQAFWWPAPGGGHRIGMGLGTVVMLVNVVLLTGFTFGCNSMRHLSGGRLDCFSCVHNPNKTRLAYQAWRCSTWFNIRHSLWAWLSLYSVGFADLYIRLCAMGIWKDVRFF